MPINESIEYFPLFDPETEADSPTVTAAAGRRVAALGTPDALGGGGAVVVYMYSEEANGWGYVGVLAGAKISGSEQVRGVGSSLAAFGDTIIVGAAGDAQTPGRVFVLRPPYGTWTYAAMPVVSELGYAKSTKGDSFGAAVAHCTDGTDHYIAVGAPGAAAGIGATGPGQIFVFKGLEGSTPPWSTSPIGNPNPEGSESDRFASTVAVSLAEDGTLTLAAGAPGAAGGQGAAYVGRTAKAGEWTSPFKFMDPLRALFPEADDFETQNYGASVALTGGTVLAVGAPNDPNFETETEDTGAVWLYAHNDGAFVAEGDRLYGPGEGGGFGSAVAFPETAPGVKAGFLVVGAPGAGAGEALRFVDAGEGYKLDQQFAALPAKPGDHVGKAVAASDFTNGSWCLVGATGVPKAGQDGGGFLFAEGEPKPGWMPMPALVSNPPLRWGGLAPDWWKKFTPQIETYL
jgi:hypothetical protein